MRARICQLFTVSRREHNEIVVHQNQHGDMPVSKVALFCGLCGLLGPLIMQAAFNTIMLDFNTHDFVWHDSLLDLWVLCLVANFSTAIWHYHLIFLSSSQAFSVVYISLKVFFFTPPVDNLKLVCLVYLSCFITLPSCGIMMRSLCYGNEHVEDVNTNSARIKMNEEHSERLLAGEGRQEDEEDSTLEEDEEEREHATFRRLITLGE